MINYLVKKKKRTQKHGTNGEGKRTHLYSFHGLTLSLVFTWLLKLAHQNIQVRRGEHKESIFEGFASSNSRKGCYLGAGKGRWESGSDTPDLGRPSVCNAKMMP